jgi:hypothetical protein
MLRLTDSQLAMIAIAATAVAPEQREQWLRDLADRVDPPIAKIVTDATNIPRRSAAAARQAKARARRRNHQHVYKLVVSDHAMENLIVQFILGGKLSESEALQPRHVARALENLLEEMGRN